MTPLALFDMPREAYRYRRCPVCLGAIEGVRPEGTVTYAMQRQGWVKIGRSWQPEVRRRVLSMPSPGCRVTAPEGMDWAEPILGLAVWAGDLEHASHERWAHLHAAGEWFMPDAAMAAWITTGERWPS